MILIKLIILFIVFYMVAKVFGLFFTEKPKGTPVRGKPSTHTLDLTKEDVEDVDFKEIK